MIIVIDIYCFVCYYWQMLSGIGFSGFFAPPVLVIMTSTERIETVGQTKTNPISGGQLVPKLTPVSAGLEALACCQWARCFQGCGAYPPPGFQEHMMAVWPPVSLLPFNQRIDDSAGQADKTRERRHSSSNNSRTSHRDPSAVSKPDPQAAAICRHQLCRRGRHDRRFGGRLPTSEQETPGGGGMVINYHRPPLLGLSRFSHDGCFFIPGKI